MSSIASDPFDINVVYFTGAPYSASTFQEYLNQIEALYATDKPFMLVMDMSQLLFPTSLSYIFEQAQFLMRNWLNIKRCVRCTCMIVGNPRILACIRLLFRIVPNQSPLYVIHTDSTMTNPRASADETHSDNDDLTDVLSILENDADQCV